MWKMLLSVWALLLWLAFWLSGCTVFLSTNGTAVRSVQVTPSNPTIAVEGKQQFTANVTFGDGTLVQIGAVSVIWASSNPTVATINSDGLAIGLGPGTTTITGTFANVGGSTTLTVTAPAQVKLAVDGSARKLEVIFLESRQRFLYIADPMNDTITLYQVDLRTGQEEVKGSIPVYPARGPTWLALDPSGKFLYVADHESAGISAFSIDPASGQLTAVAGSPFQTESSPWSIFADADGKFLSVTSFESLDVSLFHIDQATGTLTPERWP